MRAKAFSGAVTAVNGTGETGSSGLALAYPSSLIAGQTLDLALDPEKALVPFETASV